MVTPIPYVSLRQMFDESAPWGLLSYEKAVYLEELTDGAIEVILEHQAKKESPLSSSRFLPSVARSDGPTATRRRSAGAATSATSSTSPPPRRRRMISRPSDRGCARTGRRWCRTRRVSAAT
jgi:hypothetical protein